MPNRKPEEIVAWELGNNPSQVEVADEILEGIIRYDYYRLEEEEMAYFYEIDAQYDPRDDDDLYW